LASNKKSNWEKRSKAVPPWPALLLLASSSNKLCDQCGSQTCLFALPQAVLAAAGLWAEACRVRLILCALSQYPVSVHPRCCCVALPLQLGTHLHSCCSRESSGHRLLPHPLHGWSTNALPAGGYGQPHGRGMPQQEECVLWNQADLDWDPSSATNSCVIWGKLLNLYT
jgi:hypothetical protein